MSLVRLLSILVRTCSPVYVKILQSVLLTKPLEGPNATTYIIPAEIFPTRYRASCHGISAASGKFGSILVQIFSAYYKFGSSSPGAAQTKRYGIILIVFSAAMILGALVTHLWLPDVQYKDKKSKPLEALGSGLMGVNSYSVTRARESETRY